MSLIILNVDEVRRTLSASGGAFVVHDKEVDIVRFAINSGFADIVLDGQVALRVMYQRPGESEVRAQTLTYYDTDGLHNYYDWQLSQSDLAKNGSLMVALCILDISGGEVSEWHTTPCAVRVLSTIHTDDSDEGDDTITPTVKERVAVLESMIQRVASGAPIVVASTSAMTDTDQIYVLSTNGRWYYHNGSAWVAGGTYGAVATDTTLTQSGISADAKAVGDKIVDLKEDLSLIDSENVNNIKELAVNNKYYDYTHFVWNQGGPVLSNGSITFNSDSKSLNSGFIPVNPTDTFNLKVPAGYKAIIYYVDKNDGTYTVSTSSSWITNTTHTDNVGSLYHYIIVRLVKVDESNISATETQLLTVRLYVIKDSNLAGKSDLNALSADYQNFKMYTEEKLSSEVNIPYTATQGRVVVSGGALTIQSSTKFCYTSYIDMSSLSSVLVDVPSGYKVAGFLADNASGTHVTYDPSNPTNGYVTNTTVTIEKDALRPYLIVLVLKDPSATILPSDIYANIQIYRNNSEDVFTKIDEINPLTVTATATGGQILYEGDTLANSGYIVNAVMYKDGVIIGARSDGKIVRIGYNGTEEVVLSLTGTNFEWRCLYMDSNENVYASPHASFGNMNQSDRGLYRLVKGENTMSKVISLYDTGSSITTETQANDDTIWTMCEDKDGNLYAGVYAHTIRANPAVYKSMDGGETWTYFINFNTAGLTTNGMHIHSIVYSEWQDALYCIVGEINTIFKSIDGGVSWTDLSIKLTVKGSAMLPTPYGIFIGSDGAYNCEIDLLYNDDVTHKKVYRGIAGTVFAIRASDITGFLYAFTKIDSSVNLTSYYPPATVLDGTTTIEQWRSSVPTAVYNNWLAYHDSVVDMYPDDSIRPQHYTILVSRNGGKDWKPLKRFSCLSTFPNGLLTTGYFFNGECLAGRFEDGSILRPVIISEGKHRYVSDGCDLEGEILIRTNTSSIVEVAS